MQGSDAQIESIRKEYFHALPLLATWIAMDLSTTGKVVPVRFRNESVKKKALVANGAGVAVEGAI